MLWTLDQRQAILPRSASSYRAGVRPSRRSTRILPSSSSTVRQRCLDTLWSRRLPISRSIPKPPATIHTILTATIHQGTNPIMVYWLWSLASYFCLLPVLLAWRIFWAGCGSIWEPFWRHSLTHYVIRIAYKTCCYISSYSYHFSLCYAIHSSNKKTASTAVFLHK